MSEAWTIGGASAGAAVATVEEEASAGAVRRSTRAETASGRGRNEMTGEMDAGALWCKGQLSRGQERALKDLAGLDAVMEEVET